MKKGILLAALTALAIAGASAQAQDYNDGFLAAAAGDYTTAVAKWQPLAESGDANAQFNMALIYHKGLGVAGRWAGITARPIMAANMRRSFSPQPMTRAGSVCRRTASWRSIGRPA